MDVGRPTAPAHSMLPIILDDSSDDSPVSTPPQSPVEPSTYNGNVPLTAGHAPSTSTGNPSSAKGSRSKGPVDPNAPKKPRAPRKKKDPDAAASTKNADGTEKPKEKKPRKPRDPNAPPRKRQKTNNEESAAKPIKIVESHLMGPKGQTPTPQPAIAHSSPGSGPTSQIGKYEAFPYEEKKQFATSHGVVAQYSPPSSMPPPPKVPQPQPSQQPISRPRYDPIRSASAENAANPDFAKYNSPPQRPSATPTPLHARASPSIASLIDPEPYSTPRPYASTPRSYDSRPLQPASPAVLQPAPTLSSPMASGNAMNGVSSAARVVHDIPRPIAPHPAPTPTPTAIAPKPKISKPMKVDTPPAGPSPKAPRAVKDTVMQDAATAPATTNGIPTSSRADPTIVKPPPPKKERPPVQPLQNNCIVIEVPMTKPTGNYVNFMKEVEAKYGFDVAYPRVAEHKKRMAHMASLGAALEGTNINSADEMDLDGDDPESNVEMGNMDEDSTAAEGAAKKKRKAKADEYDKTDDFIDDTEQAWEEQARASKDGYFVWMGPLITDADKAAADKSGAAGRGKGGRTKSGASKGDAAGKGSRVNGASRGTNGKATGQRKPRATKAEMEERRAAKAEKDAAKAAKEAAKDVAAKESKDTAIATS